MTFGNMRGQVPNRCAFSFGSRAHFRVVYQRQYPQAVEEVVYTERFGTTEEAQKFVDAGLRAQRIHAAPAR